MVSAYHLHGSSVTLLPVGPSGREVKHGCITITRNTAAAIEGSAHDAIGH
jgi:hypothetical protein